MANLKSSKKDALRMVANRLINKEAKNKIKVLRKKTFLLATEKQTELAEAEFRKFVSTAAKAKKRNIIKLNKFSRIVSRLHHKIKALGCFA